MSSFAGYCKECGKPVMHKTLFGTLHLCLSTEERVAKKMMAQQQVSPDNFLRTIKEASQPYRGRN